ncbi:MAG: XrtA/PEP-CTERM system histidine kinase PrsK [Sphingobium sp.]|nr:XrtA/PEP-CTERM system histidine kinase PrsK [Sphingobium sp.]
MNPIVALIGDWSHAVAAALFAALALWLARRRDAVAEQRLLVTALGMTAFWAINLAMQGVAGQVTGYAESLRNLCWLLFLFVLLRRGKGDAVEAKDLNGITALYGLLAALLVAQGALDGITAQLGGKVLTATRMAAVMHASLMLRMVVAIGALVVVHNLYLVAAPEGRAQLRLPLAALAAMWTYDLNLYGFAYLRIAETSALFAMRGVVMAGLVPVIALGVYRTDNWTLRLSRAVAFRSLSLVAICAYLVLLALLTSAFDLFTGEPARLFQIALVFGTSVGAILLLPSSRFRAWMKVTIAKNLFQHRYDYRREWMRFSDMIGRPGEADENVYQRVVHALADMTDSVGGLLFLREEDGSLMLHAGIGWPTADLPLLAMEAPLAERLEREDWLFDIDGARKGEGPFRLPRWMLDDPRAWMLLPLKHFDRLTGAVLLARPRFDRRPDWEDFDLLRAAGRQAASYISEARGQEALSEAQRFEEFNRRFAFILHDIKNLVSQISLLARNAQRHADNPEFRADMILTLEETAGRMNEMLARLTQRSGNARSDPLRPVDLRALAEQVARARRGQHLVQLTGQADVSALGDPRRIELILTHLLQNAIEASSPAQPVLIGLGRQGGWATIDIVDHGCGMSAQFIRNQLFKPFRSEKAGGFGIGAFEARSLAEAMGGKVEVDSREGEGSCFTLFLPLAPTGGETSETEQSETMSRTIGKAA